ncbi:predicted protein [Sclerotinia sclerotiorum 1980 UF-70]|uniref:Ubiquitin 3 binding protein But2 C-terminal domain-containing protein n=2 Tax=Sclerotinia sclerotiorum (strain ATCC 18683 / 1980 / Ss-1) TaxID=665079 RepID=A7F7T8_SCLS1|nr:predicted protein [Sclerotinia sclerotiorum 1980 UF-70]APA14993.1 hypothetical protein sscle_14g097630 [Sclerotinia sclerotiorum 1980 UF-70]EDN98809.1 predicted protein [Sclerotinia sclerotiorum 1980 UF-70]
MQFSTLLTLITSLALTNALPLSPPLNTESLTFHGAAGAQYTLSVPLDGSVTRTYNALSISSISTSGFDVKQNCRIHAVDYTPALVEGPDNTWVIGPPQTIIDISCTSGGSTPSGTVINIELDGAADAKYFISVPLGGGPVYTNNPLSISQVRSTYPNIPACAFDTVDIKPAFVQIATGVWNMGPPQTVRSVSCSA